MMCKLMSCGVVRNILFSSYVGVMLCVLFCKYGLVGSVGVLHIILQKY